MAERDAGSALKVSVFSRRASLGLLVATVIWLGIEGGMRAWRGSPPPSDFVAQVGACTLTASRLDCVGAEQDVDIPARGAAPRVVVLGGSTVRNPFDPGVESDFSTTRARELPGVEVLNLGVAGLATAGVAALAVRLEGLDPDLVILSTGHNDYSQDVFRGAIRASGMWTLPIHRLLQPSWIHTLLGGGVRGTPRMGRQAARVTTDDTALRVRGAVNERFAGFLEMAIRASPAPVIVASLLRNFDEGPQGELVAGKPDCATRAPHLPHHAGQVTGWSTHLRAAREACGDGALTAWFAAHVATDKAEAVRLFGRSLALDAIPLRAPLEADAIMKEVAEANGARYVDVDAALGPLCPDWWFNDALHLNAAGARAYGLALVPAVKEELGAKLLP